MATTPKRASEAVGYGHPLRDEDLSHIVLPCDQNLPTTNDDDHMYYIGDMEAQAFNR